MKSVTPFNGTDIDQAVVLKNKGALKTLDIKIGEVRVELWEPNKPNAAPYACLVLAASSASRCSDGLPDLSHEPAHRVTLDQMHASALANALASWVCAIEARVKAGTALVLSAEFPSLLVQLYGPSANHAPLQAELTYTGSGSHRVMATLTYLETNVLVQTLNLILPDSQERAER